MTGARSLAAAPIPCDACPVGRAWGVSQGGFCPMITRRCAPGEVICRAAYPADRIWFLQEGVVASETEEGVYVRIPGSVIGVEALRKDRYAATVRALTSVTLCGTPRRAVLSWLKRE